MGKAINLVGFAISNRVFQAGETKRAQVQQRVAKEHYAFNTKLPLFMEDLGSMYSWWTTSPSGQKQNAFETEFWLPLLDEVESYFQLQKKRFGSRGFRPFSAKRSTKHLTCFELFLIDRVLAQQAPDQLILNPSDMQTQQMHFELVSKRKGKQIGLHLTFDSLSTILRAYEAKVKKKVLELKYSIRSGLLEEIEGTLFKKHVLMDPVWEKESQVIRDQLVLAQKRFTWILNKKEARAQCGKDVIFIKQTGLEKQKQKFFCIDKEIRINKYCYDVRQLFSTRFLLPLVACAKKKLGSVAK